MKNRESSRLLLDMKWHDIDVFDEFGRYNYVSAQSILPTHIHPNMIEICYLAKGSQEYFVGKDTYKLYGGDIFITFPNEIHGTGDVPEEKGILYWMVLKEPEYGKTYLGLGYDEAMELFSRLLHLPKRLFKGDSECERLLLKAIHTYFQNKGLLTTMELNNVLVSYLLQVIHDGEKREHRAYSDRISMVLHLIDGNIFQTPKLEELAERCNLSLSRFKHLFKEETGIPPSEYIIRKKIKKAKEMLEEQNLSIKDIAYDLDFSSPAYFATVFKQYNGYSPTSYIHKTNTPDTLK